MPRAIVTMAAAPGSARSRMIHRGIIAAGFVVVAWFYAWTNDPTGASWRIRGEQSDYYNLLIHGLLKGHLYMDTPVAKELIECPDPWNPAVRSPHIPILQDATYYQGRYYLYYGPAPVVTLMMPFRLITGADLPLSLATLCFAWGGLLVSLLLWESIRERYFPEVRAWVGFAAVLIVGVANPLPVLLRRTLVYELPIVSGFFFSMAALLALYWSIHSSRRRIAWLAAASVCLGLAVASRLTFLFTMPILLVPLWHAWRHGEGRSFSHLWRAGVAAIGPIAAIGAMMAAYNYARFGELGEFGTKYQVAEMFNLMTPRRFALDYVAFNLVDYLLATPNLSPHFPYFHFPGAWRWPIQAPAEYWGPELVPGLLACFPICSLALLAVFPTRQTAGAQRGELRAWQLCLWGLFLGTALCLLCYYAGAVRYMVDFTPSLLLGAALGLLFLESWLLRRRAAAARLIGRAAWLGLLAVSVLVGVMFSLGVRATFRAVDPVGHARVARFFERLSFWNPRLVGQDGPVELTLQLEKNGDGAAHPLLACGAGQESEEIFLRWSGDTHVVLGYRRGLNAAPELSDPIAVQRGSIHRVYIDLGSLYGGAADRGTVAGAAPAKDDEVRKRWLVRFDDTIVLKGRYPGGVRPDAGDLVFLGYDPNYDDFGKTSLTPILSAQRHPAGVAAQRAASWASMRLEFKTPRDVSEGSQSLLAIVGAGGECHAEVEYLSEARARLIFRREGRELARSGAFPNDGRWRRLELEQVFNGSETTVDIRMDRASLGTIPGEKIDLRSHELRLGWGTAPGFTGFIRNASSEGVQPVRPAPRGNRITLSVIFPRQRTGVSEPLLVTGQTAAGDLYHVAYLDQDRVSFRHDHWGAGIVRTSRPFKVGSEAPHRIEFEFAPQNGGVVRMKFDGQNVWEEDVPYHAFKEDDFSIGRNDIGGSSCLREFSGEFISWATDAPPARPRQE